MHLATKVVGCHWHEFLHRGMEFSSETEPNEREVVCGDGERAGASKDSLYTAGAPRYAA